MHTKSVVYALLLTILVPGTLRAAEKTIWECRTSNDGAKPILNLVEWGSRSYIKFAHMRFNALYQEAEGMPGWYWHNDGSGYYRYGIVVDQEKKGWFHDFGERKQDAQSTVIDYLLCSELS